MMWRRIAVHLETLTPWKYASNLRSSGGGSAVGIRSLGSRQYLLRKVSCSEEVPSAFFSHLATSDADQILSKGKKRVEDIMPIATGHEREEIEAELEGRKRFDMDAPFGPFGTKEAPAEIQSYYDKRIVGCPGGEGEDEHDVVWFWLEKNKPHECPVCSQYFVLKVIGEGGPPEGHDDDGHH